MEAGAGKIPLVTVRDNINCTFKDSAGNEKCSFRNDNVVIPTDMGVCGEYAAGALFQDIPKPPAGTTSPSGYCQL